MSQNLTLQFSRLPQSALFTLEGRLDGNSAAEFGAFVTAHLQPGDTAVVLDCRLLGYISSAGLRELLKLAKLLNRHQKRPAIAGASASVSEALEISGFNALFHCKPDLESARQAVEG